MLFRWNKNFRKPGRVSKCRRPNLEFLEDRITPVASLIDIAETGVPNFPIPAGSTLIATSDSGKRSSSQAWTPMWLRGNRASPR